jgi:hypothetical protein
MVAGVGRLVKRWAVFVSYSCGCAAVWEAGAGAIAFITPSGLLVCGFASHESDGLPSMWFWPRQFGGCWSGAGARNGWAFELRGLFVDRPLRWLCRESIYQAVEDPAIKLTGPVHRRRRRRLGGRRASLSALSGL